MSSFKKGIIILFSFIENNLISFRVHYRLYRYRMMNTSNNFNYERIRIIFSENKLIIIGIIFGLLIGGGISSLYMNNKMSNATNRLNEQVAEKEDEIQAKNAEIDDLEADILELESTLEEKNNMITSLEDTVEELAGSQSANTEEIEALQDYIEDLEDQILELESDIRQKNQEINSLVDTVDELDESLSEYEDQVNITMMATGTEWEDPDDYDLESSFREGYSEDFLVIYEMENMYHSKIYQLAIDIYIISGGVIHDSIHRSSFGSAPQEGDWTQSFVDEFDISGLDYGYYTVVLTATDLISGESDTKTYDFEITLN